ncbi:Uncharacterised protein [Bordetella trematum]|uniref:ERF family protein n=1 Tax=Bordetella trematum TaxID=123899 RepID=UPI000791D59D|nr:ERF family protein [Bordetella trematum]SAI62949.1 Uncharacterised protein [Bordetella trematum]
MSQIHAAMLAIMTDVAREGISKSTYNKDQKFHYRGIEAAMNTMAGILIRHRVLVLPRYSEIQDKDKPTKSGGSMEYVKVKGLFTFMSADDGSTVEAEFFGEGCDVSDKATTKAQSVAFRTALFQTFVVPTMAIDPEGDEAGEDETVSQETQELLDRAQGHAEKGLDAYREFFSGLTKEQRHAIGSQHDEFKRIAEGAGS